MPKGVYTRKRVSPTVVETTPREKRKRADGGPIESSLIQVNNRVQALEKVVGYIAQFAPIYTEYRPEYALLNFKGLKLTVDNLREAEELLKKEM